MLLTLEISQILMTKIIKKAVELGKNIKEITDFYTDAFHKEMQAIGVARPDIEPKATQSLDAMFELIQKTHRCQSCLCNRRR